MTAATWCLEASTARSDGTAASGVPAKTIRSGSAFPRSNTFAVLAVWWLRGSRQCPAQRCGPDAAQPDTVCASATGDAPHGSRYAEPCRPGRSAMTALAPGRAPVDRVRCPAGPDGGRRRRRVVRRAGRRPGVRVRVRRRPGRSPGRRRRHGARSCRTPSPTPRGDALAYTVRLVADGALGAAGTVVGTSSLGDPSLPDERIHLGWTGYSPSVWGTAVNPECKLLLLTHVLRGVRLRPGEDPDRHR